MVITQSAKLEYQLGYMVVPLTFDENSDTGDLFKAFDVRIDDESENLVESILQYFLVMSQMANIRLFVFVNLKNYINPEELSKLYQALFYEKIFLLDIEAEQRYSLDEEKAIIIDKDKCVIEI